VCGYSKILNENIITFKVSIAKNANYSFEKP